MTAFALIFDRLIWLNCVILVGPALFATNASGTVIIAGTLAIAAAASMSWYQDRTGGATRISTSLALAGQAALLVYAFADSPLQIDSHMYFFASLAICAGWIDWCATTASRRKLPSTMPPRDPARRRLRHGIGRACDDYTGTSHLRLALRRLATRLASILFWHRRVS